MTSRAASPPRAIGLVPISASLPNGTSTSRGGCAAATLPSAHHQEHHPLMTTGMPPDYKSCPLWLSPAGNSRWLDPVLFHSFPASLRALWGSLCPSDHRQTGHSGLPRVPDSRAGDGTKLPDHMSPSLRGHSCLSCPGQGRFSAPVLEAGHPHATYNHLATCESVWHGLLNRRPEGFLSFLPSTPTCSALPGGQPVRLRGIPSRSCEG